MEVGELIAVIREINDPVAAPMVATLVERLQHLVDIGLEYLSLNRETDTLSGGESQRVKMVKHLGSSLVDVMYIFDEPSVGLHPRDVHRLNELLQKLRDKGNTVLVVEHDPDVIKVADHVVDVGPHAGSARRRRSSSKAAIADLLQGRHADRAATCKQSLPIKADVPPGQGQAADHATPASNNLQNVSVDIPTGVLTVVTGVAGSGKSSLINEVFLRQHPEAIVIDQSAVGVSTPLEPGHLHRHHGRRPQGVRRGQQGQTPALFSFNSKGACENCKGSGVIYTDLAFLDGVKTPCEICEGKRFKDEVLAYKLNGKSITDVLAMTVAQALDFFDDQGDRAQAAGDERRRAGLPDARPAAQHALGRRVPAHQAGQRAAQEGQHLRAGRADHRPAHVRHQPPAGDHEPPGGRAATR